MREKGPKCKGAAREGAEPAHLVEVEPRTDVDDDPIWVGQGAADVQGVRQRDQDGRLFICDAAS